MVTVEEQRRVIESARLPEVTRRELVGRTRLEAVRKQATARKFEAEKEMALKQLQKVEQQFEKVRGVATISADKKRMAYEVLVNEINRNMRKHPFQLSGRGVRESMEAFSRAGLDPQEAKRIYTKAIKTSGAYIFGEERAMEIEAKYFADVEASLEKAFPTELPSFMQPTYESEAQREFYEKFVTPTQERIRTEEQRYKEMGYTQLQAQKLATESLKKGGVSFTPARAEEIIKPTFPEKVGKFFEPRTEKWKTAIQKETEERVEQRKLLHEKSYEELLKESPANIIYKVYFDTLGKGFVKAVDKKTNETLGTRLMTEEELTQYGDMFGTLFLFSTFAPFMQTGAVKKQITQKQIQEQLSKTKFDKLGQFINKVKKDLLNKKAGKEQLKYLNKLFDRLDKSDPKVVEDFKRLLTHLYEEGVFKGVPIDFYTKPTEAQTIAFHISGLPTMEQAGAIAGVVSALPLGDISRDVGVKLEEVGKIPWLGKDEGMEIREIPWLFQPEVTLTKEQLKELEKQKERLGLGLPPILTQPSILKQEPAFKQPSVLAQPQPTALAQPPISALAQPSVLRQEPVYRQIPRQVPKKKITFFPPLKIGVVAKAKGVRVLKKEEDEFSIYIRRGGVWRKVGKEETLKMATRKAEGIVSTTLAASFQIKRDKTPVKIDILGREFRPAKREPFVYVEKRQFRLGTLPEVKEIQMFKKKAPKKKKNNPNRKVNLFGDLVRKKKGGKKQKSKWF